MEPQLFYQLVDKYLDGTASPEERQLVEGYFEKLSSPGSLGNTGLSPEKIQSLKSLIYSGIHTAIHPPARRIPLYRRPWFRISAAASILLILAGLTWFLWKPAQNNNLAGLPSQQRYKNDILPRHQNALLTLADGSLIQLDSAGNGRLAAQGTTQIVKQDGSLTYHGMGFSAVFFNTVSTGKGRDFHLQLADGTGVWLDALSSIRFPTAFPGADRMVEVSGQAYFEVAKNPRQPFKVKTGNQLIEVLGTHFNINAYGPAIKTTLLEGSVKVIGAHASAKLQPGQQASVTDNGEIKLRDGADLEETVAWKEGRFRFNGSSVEDIMNQVARWYDVDVVYQDKIPETFVARISRDLPVSRLLNLLEMTKQVSFTIDGKKLTVMKPR